MRVLGLDIGSRTVEAVWLDDGVIARSEIADSGFDPQAVAASLIALDRHDAMVATGYGRHLARDTFDAAVVTEIRAYALGARALFPHAAAVLDIGGQDTKAISLDANGHVADFEMNDKCAAGTGKFLEVMARALGYELSEMAEQAAGAPHGVSVSSMCTVFAESEVCGLVHRGEDRACIARGLHESITSRTLSALSRVGAGAPLVFAGGVARNAAMVRFVSAGFAGEVLVPDDAQSVGALGAALSAGY